MTLPTGVVIGVVGRVVIGDDAAAGDGDGDMLVAAQATPPPTSRAAHKAAIRIPRRFGVDPRPAAAGGGRSTTGGGSGGGS